MPKGQRDTIFATQEELEAAFAKECNDGHDAPLDPPSTAAPAPTPHAKGSTNISKEDLKRAALFAKLAYTNNDEIERQQLKDEGFGEENTKDGLKNKGYDHHRIKTKDLSADIYIKDGEVSIAFRGTKETLNWIRNLNSSKTHERGFFRDRGRAHRGFTKAFKEIWPLIEKQVRFSTAGTDFKDINFNLVGHSLGGAMATLGGLYLKKIVEAENVKVTTFGSPRVFNTTQAKEYEELMGQDTVRVVQQNKDPITAVPPKTSAYQHVGVKVQVELDQGLTAHKMRGYNSGIEKLNDLQKPDIDKESKHRVSKALSAVHEATIGNIQHGISKLKSLSSKKSWVERTKEESNDQNKGPRGK